MNEHEANFRKTLADLQFQTYFTSEAIQTRQLLELLVAVECYLEGYLLDVTKKDSYTFHLKLMCDDSKKEGEKLKNFVVKLCKDYKFDFIQVIKTIAGLSEEIHATKEQKLLINKNSFSILELFGIWSICNYLKREIVIVDDKKILTKQQMDEFFKKKGEYTERNLLE